MTVTATSATPAVATAPKKTGLAALGQGDFLKMMTTQLQMQDPFEPMDQKDMLAQMAQFSSLSGIAEMGETLKAISTKLDAIAAQQAKFSTPTTPQTGS